MRWSIAGAVLSGLLLMGPAGSAHARVTGITFEPRRPAVGETVAAVATDDGKHEVARWDWSYTFTDAGTGDGPVSIPSAGQGRASLDFLTCGGTYEVTLKVTYGGPTPPPPETVWARLIVPRPNAIRIVGGLGMPVAYTGTAMAIELRSRVLSRGDEAGMGLGGMAQRRIRNRTWWAGKKDSDQPWEPPGPGNLMARIRGEIMEMVLLDIKPEEWAKVPVGKPVVTWDEDVRLTYILGYRKRFFPGDPGGKEVTVECSLGTEHLAIVKVDDQHWVVRRIERAGAKGAPAGQGKPGGEPAPASKDRAADGERGG